MKITYQVSLYFTVFILFVIIGMGVLVHRMNMMGFAHQQLIKEWEELKTMNDFINEIDQLIASLSIDGEAEFFHVLDVEYLNDLAEDLNEVREASIYSDNFEKKEHSLSERKDFLSIYNEFLKFQIILKDINTSKDPVLSKEYKNNLLQQLENLRNAGARLQSFYLIEIGNASNSANVTHQQIMVRGWILMILFLVFLIVIAVLFVFLINRNTQTVLDKEKNITIGLIGQSLSHEIRNPLGIIKSSTSVIRQKLLPDSEEYEIAGYLGEEADRISNLIDQLQQLKSSNAQNLSEENLSTLINQVQMLLKGVSQKADVSISYVNHAEDERAICDKNQIKQVLINVLLNAIEASEPAGQVSVCTEVKNNMYSIRVQNSGIPISAKEIKKVFNSFFTTKETGSGLGLYVARNIIQANKGNIRIESDEVTGTVLTIELRLARKE